MFLIFNGKTVIILFAILDSDKNEDSLVLKLQNSIYFSFLHLRNFDPVLIENLIHMTRSLSFGEFNRWKENNPTNSCFFEPIIRPCIP